MIIIISETYRGSSSDAESTFASVQEAEKRLTELFGEPIRLGTSDYREAVGMLPISIPQATMDYWEGTTGIQCPCGGKIEWAEAAYASGTRACRTCLAMFRVRGEGADRKLVPQSLNHDNIIGDATADDEVYRVPANLYPGWHVPKK